MDGEIANPGQSEVRDHTGRESAKLPGWLERAGLVICLLMMFSGIAIYLFQIFTGASMEVYDF